MVQNRCCGVDVTGEDVKRQRRGGEGPKHKETQRWTSPQRLCLYHPTPSCMDLSPTDHHRKAKWNAVESGLWDNSWKLPSKSKMMHKTTSAGIVMDVVQIQFYLSQKKIKKLNTRRIAIREKHFSF